MPRDRKGFTLIEMLVVIAVIAVLVAVVIPTVSSSTSKAEAAANAANLRSIKGQIVTAMLTGDGSGWIIPEEAGTITAAGSLPDFKGEGEFEAVLDDAGNVTVSFGGKTIDDWAAIAEGGSAPAVTPVADPNACPELIDGVPCTGTIEGGICSNIANHV